MIGTMLAVVLLGAPVAEADEGTLVVAKAGDGAKRVLALGAGAGTRRATTSLDITATTALFGQEVVIDMPPITAGLDLTGKALGASGYELAFAYTDVQVAAGEEMGRMAAQKTADKMRGVSGTMTITPDGRTSGRRTASGSTDDFDMELWIPHLPTVPVGAGASWTWTSTETDPQGFAWTETTTYDLLTLEPGRATIAIKTERRAGAGSMKVEGMTVPVTSIVETGTGTAVVRDGQPFPEAGAWHLDITTSLTMLGQPAKMTSKMDAKLGETK